MRFTSRALRDAMGLFPTGVAVVTTRSNNGSVYGVTVNSFNSVSLEPPLVLFSLARNLYVLPAYLSAEVYAINILREDQRQISERFASLDENKWESVEHREGVTGSPVLQPMLGVLECRHYAHYEGGDHVIFVGKVVHLERPEHHRPLVFFRGRYHRLNLSMQDENASPISLEGESS